MADAPMADKFDAVPPPDAEAFENEALPPPHEPTAHRVHLPQYFLSRYPVTVAQFRVFFEACAPTPAGGRAWHLRWPREGPARWERSETLGPECIADEASRPVRWVSFWDALAYCAWLTDRLRADVRRAAWTRSEQGKWLARVLTTPDVEYEGRQWVVTVPSEAEWEKGARGPGGWTVRPWDVPDRKRARSSLDPTRANYSWDEAEGVESGAGPLIWDTSAVGAFRAGAQRMAPDGRERRAGGEDLVGNVWEWTRSVTAPGNRWSPKLLPYPYPEGLEAAAREDPMADQETGRVVRGGSFGGAAGLLRSAFRLNGLPRVRRSLGGFRVVVAPFAFDPLISVPLNSEGAERARDSGDDHLRSDL